MKISKRVSDSADYEFVEFIECGNVRLTLANGKVFCIEENRVTGRLIITKEHACFDGPLNVEPRADNRIDVS